MLENIILSFDRAVRTLTNTVTATRRNPSQGITNDDVSEIEAKIIAGLMRINHTGEVCAQALYQGQLLTARDPQLRQHLEHAADEENDHLAWTAQRLSELHSRASLFNPLWYAGSFTLGAIAGIFGDRWNLGFLAETERQVEAHLGDHLDRLPAHDQKSRAILQQMRNDEAAHARMAEINGGADLPFPIPQIMRHSASVMKAIVYRI